MHTAHYTSPRVLCILVRMAPCPLQLAPSQIARYTTRAMHSTVDALQTLSLSAAAGPDIRVPGYLVPCPAHISQGDAQRESAKLPSSTTAPRGSSVPSRGLHWVHGSDARNLRMGIPGPLQQRREPSPAEVVALLRGSPPWLRRLLGGSFHAQRRYRSAFASPPCAGAHPPSTSHSGASSARRQSEQSGRRLVAQMPPSRQPLPQGCCAASWIMQWIMFRFPPRQS